MSSPYYALYHGSELLWHGASRADGEQELKASIGSATKTLTLESQHAGEVTVELTAAPNG